jgi:hypothetical protein
MEDFQKDLVSTFEKLRGSSDPVSVMSANKAIDKIESNEAISKKKKKETREATGASSAGQYAAPLFSEPTPKETDDKVGGKVPEVRENEKGFKVPKLTMFSDESKEYKLKTEEVLKGGIADNKTLNDIAKKHKVELSTLTKQLNMGIKTEMEHTSNKQEAKEIAMDHLAEDPSYYSKLKKMENKEGNEKEIDEKWSQKYKNSIDCSNPKGFSQKAHCQGKAKKSETKEATGAASAGSYSQPSIWAKSTNKKDWAAARKTQIPGGQFVTVKKKCKKFPYCNQGDIKSLKLWENETMKKVISNVCGKTGLDENTVKAIIQYELEISGKIL